MKQITLKNPFKVSGKGLHTGLMLETEFLPAPANHGYKIQRTDLEGEPIIEALADKKAERSIYDFFAPIMEMTADEVAALPANEFIEAVKRIGEENDLASFFSFVSGALGKN